MTQLLWKVTLEDKQFDILAQGLWQRAYGLSDDLAGLLSHQRLFWAKRAVHELRNFAMNFLDVCIDADFTPSPSTA